MLPDDMRRTLHVLEEAEVCANTFGLPLEIGLKSPSHANFPCFEARSINRASRRGAMAARLLPLPLFEKGASHKALDEFLPKHAALKEEFTDRRFSKEHFSYGYPT